MKALLAIAGVGCAMLCLTVVAVVELIARYLPLLLAAAFVSCVLRWWNARRRAIAAQAGPIVVSRALPPLEPSVPDESDVYLVAGDHRGLRPPLTPLGGGDVVPSGTQPLRTSAIRPAAPRRRRGGRVRP
jgi:hypothetical protein